MTSRNDYTSRGFWTIAVIAFVVVACCATAKSRKSWDDGARERLSDYLFMEAQRQNAIENSPTYFELLNEAKRQNPKETFIGHDLGYIYMLIADKDSTLFDYGYSLLRAHFNAHPEDYYSSAFYGQVNDQIRDSREAIRVWQTLDSLFPNKIDVANRYAEALAYSGDTANVLKALKVYDRIEVAEGKSIGLSRRKIIADYFLKDTTAIVNEINSLLSNSQSIENNMFAGDTYQMLHDNDKAMSYYNRACEIDSTNGLAIFRRANMYAVLGDSVAYDSEVFKALKSVDLELDSKLEIFKGYIQRLYSDSTQTQRITALFDVLEEQNPHEAEVHDMYSAYLYAIDDMEGAAEQSSKALDIDPSDSERWRGLQGLYLQNEEYDKAAETGERALHYFPYDPAVELITANAYSLGGNIDKAREHYQKALANVDSTNFAFRSNVYTYMADMYYKNPATKDSAFEYYEEALRLNPSNLNAMNNYAYFLACEGKDLDRAEQLSAITVRNEPDNINSLDTYAWIFFKKENYALAKLYIDNAINLLNGQEDDSQYVSSEMYDHAGDIYYMNDNIDEAVKFWEKALSLDPDNHTIKRKVEHKSLHHK